MLILPIECSNCVPFATTCKLDTLCVCMCECVVGVFVCVRVLCLCG